MMESLIQQLQDVEVQQYAPMHEVTVLGAHATLVVAKKYFTPACECDIYEISLGTSRFRLALALRVLQLIFSPSWSSALTSDLHTFVVGD